MTNLVDKRIPILTCTIGDKNYALPIDFVVEVAAMVEFASIADAEPALLGIINRHGQVVPLIDLRIVFNVPVAPIDPNVLFIVAEFENTLVGLVVDSVNQVEYISDDDLRVAPGGSRWIEQVASYHDELIQIISLKAIIKHLLPETIITKQEVEDG